MPATHTFKSSSGNWNNPGNWAPSGIPGTADSAVINGPTSATFLLLGGTGSDAILDASGNIGFTGGPFALGTAAVSGSLFVAGGNETVTARSLVFTGSFGTNQLEVDGPSDSFAVAGGISATAGGATMIAVDGAVLGMSGLNDPFATIYADPLGAIDVGGAAPVAGALEVAPGATAALGDAVLSPAVIDGVVNVVSDLDFNAAVSGTGDIALGSGGQVTFGAGVGPGLTTTFQDNASTASVAGTAGLGGTFANFIPGDGLQIAGLGAITSSVFAPGSGGRATLTLMGSGGATLGTVNLLNPGASGFFAAIPEPFMGPQAQLLVEAINGLPATAAAPAGPGNGDGFTWNSLAGGKADVAANWLDAGIAAAAAPGATNAVTFGPGATGYQAVAGDLHAASLTFNANYMLGGAFSTAGSLAVGADSETAEVLLLPGATLSASSAQDGGVLLAGNGAHVAVGGDMVVGSTGFTQPILAAVAGGDIAVGGLTLSSGFLPAVVAIDALSSLTVGAGGTAAVGSLVIAPDGVLSGDGDVFGASAIVDDGTVSADASLDLAAPLTGTGEITVGSSADVQFGGAVAAGLTVAMTGTDASLDLSAVPANSFAATVTGFAPGDAVLLTNSGSVSTAPTSGGEIVTLYDTNDAPAQAIKILGSFTGQTFLAVPSGGPGAPGYLTLGIDVGTSVYASGTLTPASPDPSVYQVVTADPTVDTDLVTGSWAATDGLDVGTLTIGNSGTKGDYHVYGPGPTLPPLVVNAGSVVVNLGTARVIGATMTVGAVNISNTGTDEFGPGAAVEVWHRGTVQAGSVTFATGEIEVGAGGVFEVGTVGGAAPNAVTVDADRSISGSNFGISANVIDYGSIDISAGSEGTIIGNLTGTGTVHVGAGGTLYVTGNIGPGITLVMEANASVHANKIDPAARIQVLGLGVSISLGDGFTGVLFAPPAAGNLPGAVVSAANPATTTLDLTNDGTVATALTLVGNYAGDSFVPILVPGFNGVGTIIEIAAAPCFAAGTHILTEAGEVPVEALRAGNLLPVRPGLRPIVWIGQRRVDCRRHPKPADVWPVRIAEHAFGPGRPHRSLLLSPDHAVLVDEVLIPIRHLINGVTITQLRMDVVTYFHVELPRHEVLLAEGLACESYLDTGNRSGFGNAGGAVMMHPDFALCTWEARACARLVVAGPELATARRLLLERAETLCASARHYRKITRT